MASKNMLIKIERLTQQERRKFEALRNMIDLNFLLESALEYLKSYVFINRNSLALYIIKHKLNIPTTSKVSVFELYLRWQVSYTLTLIKNAGGITKWSRFNYIRVDEVIKDLTIEKIIKGESKND